MVLLAGGRFKHKFFSLRWWRGTVGEYLSDAAGCRLKVIVAK